MAVMNMQIVAAMVLKGLLQLDFGEMNSGDHNSFNYNKKLSVENKS
jgi:hypothetical protein